MQIRWLIVVPLVALVSCNQPTLEEEMDQYCDCVKDEERGVGDSECIEIMQKISDKYAFDPEAAEEIEQRVQECRDSE
jgi:hypothetical protein